MQEFKTRVQPAIALSFALSLSAFSSQAYAAHVVVDTFDAPQAPITVVSGTGSQTDSSSVQGAGIIGDYRDMIIMADPNSPGATSTVQVDNGLMRFSNDSQASSALTIQWDGGDNSSSLDTSGLGGIDMTAANRNAIEFGIAFDDRPATLEFVVYSMDGSSSIATLDTTGWIDNATTMTIRFSDFIGVADFTNIGAMTLSITSSLNALDFEMSHLETVTVVPVPAAVWFMGSALLSLGFARRRRTV